MIHRDVVRLGVPSPLVYTRGSETGRVAGFRGSEPPRRRSLPIRRL
jgi:hypothetical protein